MIPGSVQAVKFQKRVVKMRESTKRIGRAGVTFTHTSGMTNTASRISTMTAQQYQHDIAIASEPIGPVIHVPQRNLLRLGQISCSFAI